MLNEDIKVREYLKKKLAHAFVSRVLIERPANNARVTVFSARPGVVIGKNGEDIEQLRSDLQRIMGVPVHVSIEEILKPELDAQLIADSIAQQLEKRIMFRRAMKRAMQNAMRLGAQGIKVMSAGPLNGAEIVRSEWCREGRVPLHTLRADIDYATSEALTTYGIIGIKVWIYKGNEPDLPAEANTKPELAAKRISNASPTHAAVIGSSLCAEPKQSTDGIAVAVYTLPGKEQAVIVGRLPALLRDRVATEVMRLDLNIPKGLAIDALTTTLMEEMPAPIEASLLSKALLLAAPSSYALVGVFLSGAVRTIGKVEQGPREKVLFMPFGYWHLLDPDDESQTMEQLSDGISQQLYVLALRLE